jgi:hypothetical protein
MLGSTPTGDPIMPTALIPTRPVAGTQLRSHLDALATWVAERLDAGEVELAWATTRQLEAIASSQAADEQRPPAVVVGRRFAAAHAALLARAADAATPPARARPAA